MGATPPLLAGALTRTLIATGLCPAFVASVACRPTMAVLAVFLTGYKSYKSFEFSNASR